VKALKKESPELDLASNHYVKTEVFIVQKYIESPLLLDGRKFDIRLWVLITHEHKCYLFKEGYIRTSSYEFTLDKIEHPFVHLTNIAVQQVDKNYGAKEDGNTLSFK
jgi:hypothetical protein